MFYKSALAIHVLTTVFIVGPLAHLVTTSVRGLREGDARSLTTAARSATIYTFASTVVVIAGFAVMSAPSPWAEGEVTARFTEPFIWISLLLWIATVAIALTVTIPSLEKAATKITAGQPVADLAKRISASGGIIAVSYAIIIILMVVRPGE